MIPPTPKYDKTDRYPPIHAPEIAKFINFADHFGPTTVDDFKIDPQAAYIPRNIRTPQFGFSKEIRHHLWTALVRFLPI